MLILDHVHKEAYVTYGGYPVNASDQEFLIERVKGEGVTELTIPVHNMVVRLEKLHVDCVELFSLAAPSWSLWCTRRRLRGQYEKAEGFSRISRTRLSPNGVWARPCTQGVLCVR